MALTTAFARNGNRKAVPQNTADGSVSYEQGFGNLYALPPEEGGLFIDRAQFNQIMYDTTSAVISNQNSINTLNGKVTANQNSINTLNSSVNTLNTKVANIESGVSTGVVNLTTNQTIGGIKTFTNNISSPNLNLLQTQMNSLVTSGKYPLLMQDAAVEITAGTGGDFTNVTSALMYAKQTQSKQIAAITKVTLLSDFNDDLFLSGYPLVYIDCNGFKLANKLRVNHSRVLFNKLKLSGNLDTVSSFAYLYSGANIGGISSEVPGAGSSIVANSSTIIIAGNVNFSPNENQYGIWSKGASHVYILSGSNFTQSVGAYFLCATSGGLISTDDNINTSGVSVTKTNIALNTLTSNGIIFGNV